VLSRAPGPADRASGLALNDALTLVIDGTLRPASVIPDLVPRSRGESRSSREQMETSDAQWFGRDSFHARSKP